MSEGLAETESQFEAFRARTPARVSSGRCGTAYRTDTHLSLRRDHAFARDAVETEFELIRDLGRELVDFFDVFQVQTEAVDKSEYLKRPDLGRRLSRSARQEILSQCPRGMDLQIVVGDGLSSTAVATQVPRLLPALVNGAKSRGWRAGRPFAIRYCRVGVLNEIGELLDPTVIVLLIGERPGLATAESLSAYLACHPRSSHSDAHRNLVSNIHARGVGHDEAASRIFGLASQMMECGFSGVDLKEQRPVHGL